MHAKRLQDGKGDKFRCRLVAMHLAIGERLNVTKSTPSLRVARLLLAIGSLHVGEHEARDWVVGFWKVPVAFHHEKIAELLYVHPQHE